MKEEIRGSGGRGGKPMSRIIFHIDVNSAYLSWTAVEAVKECGATR